MLTFNEASSDNITEDKVYKVRGSDYHWSDSSSYKDVQYRICTRCGLIANTDSSTCPSCKSEYLNSSMTRPCVAQVLNKMKNIRDVLLQAAHGFTDTLIMPNTGTLAGVTI